GGVGSGAQGCAERIVLRAGHLGVRAICAAPIGGTLWISRGSICLRVDVQADARHLTLRAATAGLLAAESDGRDPRPWRRKGTDAAKVNPGETAAIGNGRGGVSRDAFRPDDRSS